MWALPFPWILTWEQMWLVYNFPIEINIVMVDWTIIQCCLIIFLKNLQPFTSYVDIFIYVYIF